MPHILVVDDYPVTLRVLSMQLRKGGYNVSTASSAEMALSLMAEEHFDLALFDLAMPDTDGISLIYSVRDTWPDDAIPIIVMTASVLDEDRIRAEEAGATGFLTKPVSSWELLDVIERHIASASETSINRDAAMFELPHFTGVS